MHSTFGYRSKLDKYENVDEDKLLASLTAEELQELERELADMEPDDAVPIGLRQQDQIASTSTGSFSTDKLLNYWDNDGHRLLEHKDIMEERQSDKREVDSVTWGDDQSSALKDADRSLKRESRGEAGQSGGEQKEQFHVNNSHPSHREVTRSGPCMFKGPENQNIIPNYKLNSTPGQMTGNPVVIDEVLELVVGNEASLSEVNLNNADNISMETLVRLAEALISNTHVRVFSLANTRADDRVATSVAHMLRKNSTVTTVNMDSNYISGAGVLALMTSLRHNCTLEELRFHNQRHICGGRVEMEMVQVLRENTTLLKLGYQFELPGPRMNATCLLTRNLDLQRRRRLQQQRSAHSLTTNAQAGGHRCDVEIDSSPASAPQLTSAALQPPQPQTSPSGTNSMPTRQIAEIVRQHEGSSFATKHTSNLKPTRATTDLVNNRRETILQDVKCALRPSSVRKTKESALPHRSAHSDLMEAIRRSSIHSLRKGT